MWLADERASHAHDRPRLRGRQRHAGHGGGPCARDPGRGATSRTVVERVSFPVRDPSFLSLCRLCPSLRSRHWGSGWGARANRGPPSSGVAFISLPSISAATFPNYVSKSVFLAVQSHQRVRRGLVETPIPVRCGSPCRLRLTMSPGPRSADSASSSYLSGCFSVGLTPEASYCTTLHPKCYF